MVPLARRSSSFKRPGMSVLTSCCEDMMMTVRVAGLDLDNLNSQARWLQSKECMTRGFTRGFSMESSQGSPRHCQIEL